MLESSITLVGNLVEDPHLRPVGTGTNLATFRIACSERRFDKSQEKWVNGQSLFMRVACWRQLAAHVCMSVRRGDRVMVVGRVRQRSYEARDGQRRVVYEVEADAVGVELTWRAVDVRRPHRQSSEPDAPAPAEAGTAVSAAVDGDPTSEVPASLSDLPVLDDDTEDDYDDVDDVDVDVDDDDDVEGEEDEEDEDGDTDGQLGRPGSGAVAGRPPLAATAPFSDGVSRLGTVTE